MKQSFHSVYPRVFVARHLGPSLKKSSLLFILFLLSFGFFKSFAQVGPGTAPVSVPAGGFRIEGDLRANFPISGIGDWSPSTPGTSGAGGSVLNAFGAPINAATTFHLTDPFNISENNFSGGKKFNDNPNIWTWVNNSALAKCDINNAMLHFATSMVDGKPHTWIIVAADRRSNSGSAYIDFELLQNIMKDNPNGTFTSLGPNNGRTAGDILLTLALSNGGGTAEFFVNRWQAVPGATGGFDYVDRTSARPANSVFAATNGGTISAPFSAFGGSTYSANLFVEAAIDLTALLSAIIDPCTSLGVKTIFIKTKTSPSPTATIVDFISAQPVLFQIGVAAPTVTTPVMYCLNATASALSVTNQTLGSSLLWYPTETGGTGSATAPIPLTTTAGSTTYYVSQTETTNGVACEGARAAIVVTVNAIPSAPGAGPSSRCGTGTVTLTATGCEGGTLKWYAESSGGTALSTGSSFTTLSISQTTTYYVSCTSALGCEGLRTEVVATVNAIPTAPAVLTPVVYCLNATASQLSVTNQTLGSSLSWYTTETAVTGSATAPTPLTATAGNTTYYVSQTLTTNGVACEGARAAIVVTVNPKPDVTASANPTSINLILSTTSSLGINTITPGIVTDDNYGWSIITNPTFGNSSLTNALTASPTFTVSTPYVADIYTARVTATNKVTGCSNTATVNITVASPGPLLCGVNGASPVCPSSTNSYIYDSDGNGTADAIPPGYSAAWSLVNANGATIPVPSTTNTVSVKAGSGCNTSFIIKITLTSQSGLYREVCEKTVLVKDVTAPVLSVCPAPTASYECLNAVPAPENVTANDDCNGSVNVIFTEVQSNPGNGCSNTITRTWSATDLCGNTSTCSQIISIVDLTKPSLSCPANRILDCGASTLPANTGTATAYDICSAPVITYSDVMSPVANGCSSFNITRTWKAEDANRNISTCVQLISFVAAPPVVNKQIPVTVLKPVVNNAGTSADGIAKYFSSKELIANAFPNPFGNSVTFSFVSPKSGTALLELYDLAGRKLGNVYQGMVFAGIQKNISYRVPFSQKVPLVYKLSVGNKFVNGKLIPSHGAF